MSLFASVNGKNWMIVAASTVLVCLIALGAMAKNGWLPRTDPMTGKRIGWFGKTEARNSAAVTNSPTPSPTPQLSKEYIYAGSRMLAVEDANASAAPPADLAVWRPSTGYWYVLGGSSVHWGGTFNGTSDIPVPGDYDGDGKTDFSVFRPSTSSGTWYVSNSSNGYTIELTFGLNSDKPAQADYDGDGKTDCAVFRNTGWWYITRSSDSGMTSYEFGLGSDKPAPADYDGDGKADYAVWRGSNQTFYVQRSSDGVTQAQTLGQTSDDVPVSADYDGDGKADYAVKSGNVWYIKQSLNGTLFTITWQLASDKEVQNDYDGDGRVDIAVWRGSESTPGAGDAGNWYIRQSSLGGQLRQVLWGTTGDVPVPAFYRR